MDIKPTSHYTIDIDIKRVDAIRQLIERRPHGILYHYTTRDALIKILQLRSVWASHIRYLNDAQEFGVAIGVAQSVLTDLISQTGGEEKELYREIESWVRNLEDQAQVYVFSLSLQGDQLSQWRAYGKPADGYAVGFDAEKLTRMAKAKGFFLAACEYDHEAHRRLVKKVLDDVKIDFEFQRAKGTSLQEALMRSGAYFVLFFHIIAPVLKHPAFREEQEWRLISSSFETRHTYINFRATRTLMVPYIVLNFGEEELPIAEIVIGPTPHTVLEFKSVSSLLASQPFKKIPTIRGSQVPYRSW